MEANNLFYTCSGFKRAVCSKKKTRLYVSNRNYFGQFREIPWNQTTDVHRGSTLITLVIT